MIAELALATLLHTQSPIFIKPRPTVAIVLTESNYDREQREAQEIALKARRIAPKTFYSESEVIVLSEDSFNNCVAYSKSQTGITRPMGLGGMSAIQTQEPKVGAIGVLPGHAVVIENIDGNLITFRESNYRRGFITRRTLDKSAFLGYIVS